jgi:DNA-binding LacI/PurR family transcriptional regulator
MPLFEQKFRRIKDLARRRLPEDIRSQILGPLWTQATENAMELYLEPLFERFVSDGALSACVAENDSAALLFLKFLGKKDIAVPRDVSVIGFDNTAAALMRGLTSYHFNLPHVAFRIFSFILDPRTVPMPPGQRPVEIEGMLLQRATTANV